MFKTKIKSWGKNNDSLRSFKNDSGVKHCKKRRNLDLLGSRNFTCKGLGPALISSEIFFSEIPSVLLPWDKTYVF